MENIATPTSKSLPTGFFISIFLIGIAYLGIELFLNGRFSVVDFEVYYRAAGRLMSGEDLYRMGPLESGGDGHFRYKYAPTCAVYFMPFALLPFKLAGIVFWILLSGILALGAYWSTLIFQSLTENKSISIKTLTFATLTIAVHAELELHLGQVNAILMVAYLAIFLMWQQQQHAIGIGVLWAATLFIKPYGFIFLPYFILKKEVKICIYFILFTILFFLLPLPFYGNMELWQSQHLEWSNELAIQLNAKKDLLQAGNHTIFSILLRYTPLQYLNWTPTTMRIFQFSVLGILGLGILYIIRSNKKMSFQQTAIEWALLIALIPLIALTDKNAFIFVMPAIFALLLGWQRFTFLWKGILIIGLIFVGGNIRDLWGYEWADYWEACSLLGLGATFLLFALFRQSTKLNGIPSNQ